MRADFLEFERPRGDVFLLRPHQADMARGRDGAGGDREFAVQEERRGNPAHMPELGKNAPARFVHGVGDELPAFHLLVRPQAGRVRITDAHRRDGGRLGDDQPGGGALHVIFRHQLVGHAHGAGAGAGERGHDDAVRQRQVTEFQRVKQSGHQRKVLLGCMNMKKGRCPAGPRRERSSQGPLQFFEEAGDGWLVALVEDPLADALPGDQPGLLQHRQMG